MNKQENCISTGTPHQREQGNKVRVDRIYFKPEEEKRGVKATVIRDLLGRGYDVKQIMELTGYNYRHCARVKKSYPQWIVKQEAKMKEQKLTRLLRGEVVEVYGAKITYLHFSETLVYFINTNGKIENMPKEDFIGELK